MKNYVQKIVRMFASSDYSDELTGKVHRWMVDGAHADEKEEAMRLLWKDAKAQADAGTWVSLSQVYRKAGVQKDKVRRLPGSWWRYASVAVIALFFSVAGTYVYFQHSYEEINWVESFTEAGDMNTVTLPDGSVALVNSGTMLFYPEQFKGNTRTVYLIGEASFNVKKNPDKPFVVKAATVAVTALGTEFNVSAYPDCDDVVATLMQGKIKVDCNGSDSYILLPGQQVTYQKSSRHSELADANLDDVTAWQRGLNVFRGKTVAEILEVLERRFNVTIQYNVDQCSGDRYNFSFHKESGLEEILAIMKAVVKGFDYQSKENVYYIKVRK